MRVIRSDDATVRPEYRVRFCAANIPAAHKSLGVTRDEVVRVARLLQAGPIDLTYHNSTPSGGFADGAKYDQVADWRQALMAAEFICAGGGCMRPGHRVELLRQRYLS
jgi:hypothetical protein